MVANNSVDNGACLYFRTVGLSAQISVNDVCQFGHIDRLGHVFVAAFRKRLHVSVRHWVRSYCNDRHTLEMWVLADSLRSSNAVENREIEIHEN